MRQAIQLGGVAYGASSRDVYRIQHLRIDKLEDIDLLRGSKYVQSRIDTTFKRVKNDLQAGLTVVFTGTPCQIAGLKAYLRKDYENLLTVDLVCHGVPSQKLLTESIKSYTSETDGTKLKLSFRKKRRKEHSTFIQFGFYLSKGKEYLCEKHVTENAYIYGFLRSLLFRDCCYTCPFAKSERIGDITIADFWGLGVDAGIENGKGVSLCLLNTTKGEEWFNRINSKMFVKERSIKEGICGNDQLRHPSHKPIEHSLFQHLYPKVGLKKATYRSLWKMWLKERGIYEFKQFIKKLIGH